MHLYKKIDPDLEHPRRVPAGRSYDLVGHVEFGRYAEQGAVRPAHKVEPLTCSQGDVCKDAWRGNTQEAPLL